MKVLIVVTHLLGTGHLSRALTLGRAFCDAGHDVWLASGGMPVPHMETGAVTLVQLPPVRSDGTNFITLLDTDGNPASETLFADRLELLLSTLDNIDPDVVITELFPFGRRVLRKEFSAFLGACRDRKPRPLILSSIRDILAPPSKPDRAAKTIELVNECYDAVLVHSDPAVVDLDASWPVNEVLRPKLLYTGFVAPPAAGPHPEALGSGEVIVSAGGGEVGDQLFATALAAAQQDPSLRWRLLVGGGNHRIQRLSENAPENVVVEAPRRDFRQMLYHAACSVSMCGYNTTLDILQAQVPAVLVPFDDGGEVEQTLRARSLAQLPEVEVLPTASLSPKALLAAVSGIAGRCRNLETPPRMDGATATVGLVEDMIEGRSK